MYHVVVCDLDGTLLSPGHTLTPYARKTLKLLTKRGIHFIFATGRHHIDVAQIRDSLGISAFMITSNGARVHNVQAELIFSHNLDAGIAKDLYAMEFNNADVLTNVYRNDEWFINRESPEQKAFLQESVFNYQIFKPGMLETDGVCKVYYTSLDNDQLLSMEQAINARWGDRVNVSFSLATCLEVMGGGVSKGHALKEVVKIIGYSLDDCIAFGDGMNDVEMLSMSGKGCIMQNAHPRLKARLPELEMIGSNVEDAVPHYLQKLFLS